MAHHNINPFPLNDIPLEQTPSYKRTERINNVVQRINELTNNYGLNIKSRKVEGARHLEYFLKRD